jgi:hypothetical protein
VSRRPVRPRNTARTRSPGSDRPGEGGRLPGLCVGNRPRGKFPGFGVQQGSAGFQRRSSCSTWPPSTVTLARGRPSSSRR